MNYPLPRWFAHRGGGSLAPENTLAGIRLAARMGYRAVEFDVMLSGDGTPVLIHDETLARTTNGTGRVADTSDRLLFTLDAGEGERIPRFCEAMALCADLRLLANVEIKPSAGADRETAEVVADVLKDHWPDNCAPPLLSSFSLEAMAVVAERCPALPRGLLFDVVPADWLACLRELGAWSLHCNAHHVTDHVLAEAAQAGAPVLCYTVNEAEQATALLRRGVSAFFTDRLDSFAGETTAYKGLHFGG